MDHEVVAATEIRAVGVGIRVDGYVNIVSKCRSEVRVTEDGVETACFDRNEQWFVARVDEADGVGIDFMSVPRKRHSAEYEAECCLDDRERSRSIVAFGVESGSGEAVACRPVEERVIVEFAPRQKVLLHSLRNQDARIDQVAPI